MPCVARLGTCANPKNLMNDTLNTVSVTDSTVSTEAAFLAFHEMTPDGFMMFQPIRSDDDTITDFEWTFVNKAAGRIVGRDPDDLLGKHLLIEMPGNKDEGLFDAYVSVIETGQTWQNEFHYQHGSIKAWFRTTATRSGDTLTVSFADISEVRKNDERLRHLIDGVLAFVGVLSLDGTLLEANQPAVAAAGVDRSQLIGRPFWDCFWWDVGSATKNRLRAAVADAARGERVRYDAEIQVAGGQRIWIDFQIAPVIDSDGRVAELIPSGVDITERKHAEAHKELLIKELSHRVKNTLATIQSITGQSIRSSASMDDFRSKFSARLHAIAGSHDLLVKFDHQDVPLAALIRGQVLQYAPDESCLVIEGNDSLLPGDVAHSLGLVLHELATNASKYGAFSNGTGKVTVSWQIQTDDAARTLYLTWVERGGPVVEKPTRRGFGTSLIQRSLAADGNDAEIAYDPEGVSCRLVVNLNEH